MADELVTKEASYIESDNGGKKRGWHLKQSWAEIKSNAKNIPAYSPDELDMFFSDCKDGKHNNLGMYPYEVILERVKAYFNKISVPVYDEKDKDLIIGYTFSENPSVNDLGLYLNVDRQTFFNYCDLEYIMGLKQRCIWDEDARRSVFDILIKSRQLIESFYEKSLGENRNPAGLIYWLNNQKTGWTNQLEVIQAESKDPLQSKIDPTQLEAYARDMQAGIAEDE